VVHGEIKPVTDNLTAHQTIQLIHASSNSKDSLVLIENESSWFKNTLKLG